MRYWTTTNLIFTHHILTKIGKILDSTWENKNTLMTYRTCIVERQKVIFKINVYSNNISISLKPHNFYSNFRFDMLSLPIF